MLRAVCLFPIIFLFEFNLFSLVHCAYEGAKMSKDSTDLGVVNNSGSMRQEREKRIEGV